MFTSLVLCLLAVFAVPMGWRLVAPLRGEEPQIRGIAPIILSVLLVFVVVGLANRPGGLAPYEMVLPVGFAFFLFLASLSSFAGSMLRRFVPRRRWQFSIALLLLVLPTGLAVFAKHLVDARKAADEAQAARDFAEFQLTTVEGMFGDHLIRLPASPQIELFYQCVRPDSKDITRCKSKFSEFPGLTDLGAADAEFEEIDLSGKAVECDRGCLTHDRIAAWCDVRQDLWGSVWCEASDATKLRFSSKSSERADRSDSDKWSYLETGEEGLSLHCMDVWGGKHCQAHFELAPGVHGTALFSYPNMDELSERSSDMRIVAERYWAAMTDS
ncbi:hypothetical protein [Pseudoruegeria sp. HB172150]|uniref:hypothetical protein n=1 Tax=Pseudoruegeria sp. HB172150 TaxID=2721164 RepID=UPI00155592C4|nr:hypothetical protein [Pseudoruegeria sp. HB172150]